MIAPPIGPTTTALVLFALAFQAPGARPRTATAPPPVEVPSAAATEPTLLRLALRDATPAAAAAALVLASGGRVEVQPMGLPEPMQGGPTGRVTIDGTRPIPLWEAIDRITAATGYQRSDVGPGIVGQNRPRIQLHGPIVRTKPGPAAYVGPFRFGAVTMSEVDARIYLKSPRTGPGDPEDGHAFFAAFPVATEPGVASIRLGPSRLVEAIDDRGRSLLPPPAVAASVGESNTVDQDLVTVRLPLARPQPADPAVDDRPNRRLASLQGVIPVEVARRPIEPAESLPIEGLAGRTIRAGDLSVAVLEAGTKAPGMGVSIRFRLKIDGPRGFDPRPGPEALRLANARLWAAAHHQVELVDSLGRSLLLGGGGGPDGAGPMTFQYTCSFIPRANGEGGEAPRALLKVYPLAWTTWEVPFAFRDLPLP